MKNRTSKTFISKVLVVVLAGFLCLSCANVSVWAHSHSTCKESGCSNETVKGSDYCSEHKCGSSDCKNKASKNGYCSSHKSSKNKKASSSSCNDSCKSSKGSCAVNGCSKSCAKGSSYCSKHTCSKSKCYNQKKSSASYCSKHLKGEMPDCDDYDCYDDFMDDWEGNMPDGSDAEDYWENW